MKLNGRIAIVTGASSGMGREIAVAFAREGAKVLAVARREERLKEIVDVASALPGEITAYGADLKNTDAVEKMIDIAVEKYGKLDILVNNAGMMDDMSGVASYKDNIFQDVFCLNVQALFVASRKAINLFEANGGGNIINIASVGGIKGGAAGAVYVASKHAVVGLTKNTGFMYGAKKIRCNAICPGGIKTEIGTSENLQNVNKEDMGQIIKAMATNPGAGEVEQIASVAVFLACDDSSFINGQTISVDGGWTAA